MQLNMPIRTTEAKAKLARIKVLEMVHRAHTSHIASNFSVIDIATVLYEYIRPEDVVVWSAGWKAASVYFFMAQRGEIPKEDLDKFPNSPYIGLAETSVKGVRCNGGAVGHGTPIACGIALARKRMNKTGKVYVILSDGELNEGTVWESAMFAAHHKLDNLVFLIDSNGWQAMGRTRDVINLNAVTAFMGFGWDSESCDGHDHTDLRKEIFKHSDKPRVIVCNTTKGKGVSFMQDHDLYHYKHVDDNEYEKALLELN